ncbi:MAG: DNA primase DnaG [Halobacteriota archaeon]|uniref:DNA primase DnaG n=1 Tax=Natronomonas sp. TaxID=2184060 RepID=UPI0039771FF7
MQDTAKYLVHADITAEGVVERSDVVGAVFGQTEGLLGDELDLRELQDASKVGRIDVEIDSQNGQSFGRITIATSLDQVETAILGAALETIDRVGPCRSTIEVRKIEDVRAAKRREVVERAKSLLGSAFDESMRSSRDLVEEVRESVRIEDITEYEGLPAGPRVADSDAIIVVEGRADVLTLLQYGIKNAVAVEGTDVPDAIAKLTESRTVTAFFDGDRGGELIRKELAQVGDIDYVAFAPEGRSVEDLARHEVMTALREKAPYDRVAHSDPNSGLEADPETEDGSAETDTGSDEAESEPTVEAVSDEAESENRGGEHSTETSSHPETLRDHTREIIGEQTGHVRLLDDDFGVMSEGDAGDAFDLLVEEQSVPTAVVFDGELTQKILDVAAQRGVDHVVAASMGEFVKRPTSVRIRTVDQLLAPSEA